MHSVEKPKIHSQQEIFREINSLVKTLLSRNFCQKERVSKIKFPYFPQCCCVRIKDFSATQILREINFSDFMSLKTVTLSNFEALN